MLQAYAEGVNSWIAGRDRPLPPEYTLLMTEPAPWQPSDSLVLGKLLGLMLTSNWQGGGVARPPRRPAGRRDPWNSSPRRSAAARVSTAAAACQPFAALPALRGMVDLALDLPGAEIIGPGASNAWAVAGERTATGKPILANDPHLGLMAPGLWVSWPICPRRALRSSGPGIPGIPMPLLGHNGAVAWGLTTTNGDAADLFIETLDGADAGRYLTPEGPQAFETREERIEVRFGDPVTITIRSTRHGPVVSDLTAGDLPRKEGTVVALAHAALIPGDKTAEALLGFLKAADADALLTAARQFHSPQQNLTYADTKGTIGMISRPGACPCGNPATAACPADGASGAQDWTGFVPFEALPQVRRPGSGDGAERQ